MKNLWHGGTHSLTRSLALLAVICLFYGVAACGGGGDSNIGSGDEEKHDCPPGYVWSDALGRCVPMPDGTGPGNGDTGDGPGPNGPTDGDNGPDDGDGSGDGEWGDGVQFPDKDHNGSDGPDYEYPTTADVDFDLELQEGWIDTDFDHIECIEDEDCGEGWVCIDYRCVKVDGDIELPPGDWDFGADVDLCPNGFPVCTDHSDCQPYSPPLLCDFEAGCCDVNLYVECGWVEIDGDFDAESEEEQPGGYLVLCPYGWYCGAIGFCMFDCRHDDDCDPDWCCGVKTGRCLPSSQCYLTDEDPESWPCHVCADCPEGQYCNVDTHECTDIPPPPADGCCEHTDCIREPNGQCNMHTGICEYPPDPLGGRISGMIFVEPIIAVKSFIVELEALDGTIQTSPLLFPQPDDDIYSAEYEFLDLAEDSYQIRAGAVGEEDIFEYPFNPILLTFENDDTRYHDDVDIYIGLDDPSLAVVSGTITLSAEFEPYSILLRLLRKSGSTVVTEEKETLAGELAEGIRRYEFTNVLDGTYLVKAQLDTGFVMYMDNWSLDIPIANTEGELGQEVEDIDLYFGIDQPGLGRVSGTIHHPSYFYTDTVGGPDDIFEVYLYNWYTFPYPVGKAWLSYVGETSADYTIRNIEDGSYWIKAWARVGDYIIEVTPIEYQVDIEGGSTFDGRDVFFEVPVEGACSISGTIHFLDDEADLTVEVYTDPDFLLLARIDEVLYMDEDNYEAKYFVEELLPGTYYLRAVHDLDGAELTLDYAEPVEVSLDPGPKDVTDIDFDFYEVRY